MTDIRTGNGYDVHALAEGLPLFLGGVRIALGDIGKHFPDTSEEFKGIDSKILLHRTMEMVASAGYRVSNADITIAMQRPKLAPYITPMRQTLAEIMGLEISRVSVKATTTEKLGFVGRGEGCAVYATVLLIK